VDPFAAELREFIRRLNLTYDVTRSSRSRLNAIRQGIRDREGLDASAGSAVPRLINVTVYSETGVFAGASVEVWNSAGTTLLESGLTSGSGFCSLGGPGSAAPGGHNYVVRVHSSGSYTAWSVPSTSYPVGTTTFYQCPIFLTTTTLTITPPLYGTFTLGWFAGGATWLFSATALINYTAIAGTGCATFANVPYTLELASQFGFPLTERYRSASSVTGDCPNPAGIPAVNTVNADWVLSSASFAPMALQLTLPALAVGGKSLYGTQVGGYTPLTLAVTQP
jgi:hypothetical protein